VAVAESSAAAQETTDNLWRTGRFDRYGICTATGSPSSRVRRRAPPPGAGPPSPDKDQLVGFIAGDAPLTRRANSS
jgi:hypothetical protein